MTFSAGTSFDSWVMIGGWYLFCLVHPTESLPYEVDW